MSATATLIVALGIVAAAPSSTSGDPALLFKAGILSRDPYDVCDVLYVPSEEYWYSIENWGVFSFGDTVVVTAAEESASSCGNYNLYNSLFDNTIEPWRNFDLGCGLVAVDSEYGCKRFSSFKYGVFGIPPEVAFEDGDSAHIWGNAFLRRHGSIPECFVPNRVDATRAIACVDSGSATLSRSWGAIRSMFR